MAGTEATRVAWGITGSGHFLPECLAMAERLPAVDLFLSRAAAEVLQVYGYPVRELQARFRVFRDSAASAPPVGLFYEGRYDLVVVAPATSNSVAKMVYGISDTLVTNIYAQAGKCRIPSLVFACDASPELRHRGPGRSGAGLSAADRPAQYRGFGRARVYRGCGRPGRACAGAVDAPAPAVREQCSAVALRPLTDQPAAVLSSLAGKRRTGPDPRG